MVAMKSNGDFNLQGNFGPNVKMSRGCANVKRPWESFKYILPARYLLGSTPANPVDFLASVPEVPTPLINYPASPYQMHSLYSLPLYPHNNYPIAAHFGQPAIVPTGYGFAG